MTLCDFTYSMSLSVSVHTSWKALSMQAASKRENYCWHILLIEMYDIILR